MGKHESPIRPLIRRAATPYVAGPALENVRAVCETLDREGIGSTVCYWNVYSDHAGFVSDAYISILRAIARNPQDCYLSVKAPALGFDFELVRKILAEARRIQALVHFDALAPCTVDRTFELIARAADEYPRLGCTLPGRWRRSLNDADRAIEMGLHVRVVKGEWIGIGHDETDPRAGFLNVVDRLAGRAAHVAVATHNPTIARVSLSRLKDAGTRCELELLYGLPQRPLLEIARRYGVRTRLYVPYGQSRLPYRLKEAIRHPRIAKWFIRDLWRGNSRTK